VVAQISVPIISSFWLEGNLAPAIEVFGGRMISIFSFVHIKCVCNHEVKLLQLVNVDVLLALDLLHYLWRCLRLPSSDLTIREGDYHASFWIKGGKQDASNRSKFVILSRHSTQSDSHDVESWIFFNRA